MFNMYNGPMYDPVSVQPMRDELIYAGFKELLSAEEVESTLLNKNDETVLVFINSVCGCAAGSARPGVIRALQNEKIPNKVTTVFAGMEKDAVAKVRELMPNVAPSSPFITLFKNGESIFHIPRYEIEGRSDTEVAEHLITAFNQFCNGQGPSISKEEFEKLEYYRACGSKIPLNKQDS